MLWIQILHLVKAKVKWRHVMRGVYPNIMESSRVQPAVFRGQPTIACSKRLERLSNIVFAYGTTNHRLVLVLRRRLSTNTHVGRHIFAVFRNVRPSSPCVLEFPDTGTDIVQPTRFV